MSNKLIYSSIKRIQLLILSVSYVFILGVSASSAATITIESGDGSLTPTIISAHGSIGDYPGGGKFAFTTNIVITDLHFDLPSLAPGDVDFDTGFFLTGLSSQKIAGATGPSSTMLWLFFDPIPIGTSFTIDMDVTVDDLVVTPIPSTILLLILGLSLMVWKQKRIHK